MDCQFWLFQLPARSAVGVRFGSLPPPGRLYGCTIEVKSPGEGQESTFTVGLLLCRFMPSFLSYC